MGAGEGLAGAIGPVDICDPSVPGGMLCGSKSRIAWGRSAGFGFSIQDSSSTSSAGTKLRSGTASRALTTSISDLPMSSGIPDAAVANTKPRL